MIRRALAALLLFACNQPGLPLGSDAGAADLSVAPGAADLSVAPDAGRPVGAACAAAADCAGGECIDQSPFTGGYCSAPIGECPAPGGTGPCPSGSVCINPGIPATGGLDYCVKPCAAESDCRVADGYRCCPTVEGHTGPFCYPSALCP